jgi:hypothetical protein
MTSRPRSNRRVFGLVALSAGFSLLANAPPLFFGPPLSGTVRIFRVTLSMISLVLMVVSAVKFLRGDTGLVPPEQRRAVDDRYASRTNPYEDPGWLVAVSRLHRGPRRKAPVDGVVLLRLVFLALSLAALMILFVLGNIMPAVGKPDLTLSAVVVVVGLGGIAAAVWTSNRELDVSSASALALTYRTNFFVGFALVEGPLVISFVFCFLIERTWPYLMALPLYLGGMALISPSRWNLQRRQEQIRRRGSSLSLGRALASLFGPEG